MIIRPCSTCFLKKVCSRYASIESTFQCNWNGLKSLIANMKCDWHDSLYSGGVRVSARVHRYESGDYQSGDYVSRGEMDVTGTITRVTRKGKVAVWVDDDCETENPIITLPKSRIKFIPEKPVGACELCGCPDGKHNRSSFSCECDWEGQP
jgi:hypothetical protein